MRVRRERRGSIGTLGSKKTGGAEKENMGVKINRDSVGKEQGWQKAVRAGWGRETHDRAGD